MPIEATPLEQDVVLVAVKWTAELTVLLFTGLVTVTLAKAVMALSANTQVARARKRVFIGPYLRWNVNRKR
jgi:hypothetical protein